MLKEIQFVKDNQQLLCNEGTFVGIGSSRKVFRYKDFVIKEHLHPIGFAQSQKEYCIYTELRKIGLTEYVAKMIYVDEKIAIQKYYPNLPLINLQSYDIQTSKDKRITNNLRAELVLIDSEYDGFDLKDSGNYGLGDDGYLVLIDYGMSKTLYEKEWVPLAEMGILPQLYFEKCTNCGVEKELRIYGDSDMDRRCFTCGKQ